MDPELQRYLEENFGIKSGGAGNNFFGYAGGNSYNGQTYGSSYAGGTNGNAYGGWLASNPLSGINAFSGNTGSMGFGPNPNYDPRMGMKDGGSHLGQGSPGGGGGGGGMPGSSGNPLKGGVSQDEYKPYGTGTAWGPGGGAQKYGGGTYDDMIAANQTQGSGSIRGDRGVDYHSAFSPDLPANNDPNAGNRPSTTGANAGVPAGPDPRYSAGFGGPSGQPDMPLSKYQGGTYGDKFGGDDINPNNGQPLGGYYPNSYMAGQIGAQMGDYGYGYDPNYSGYSDSIGDY